MRYLIIIILVSCLAACARFPEEEVKLAKLEIESIYYSDLPRYMPEEWGALKNVWQKLDEAEKTRNREDALRWYYYTIQKSVILDENLTKRKKEEDETARKLKDEAEKRKREIEKAKIQESEPGTVWEKEHSEKKSVGEPVKKAKTIDDVRYKIERRFPSFYTVKEGEMLEYIAGLPQIYNDRYLWPLIYKYNRNQIRDPMVLYKGQILKIPRNITMEDIYKTREEAGAKNPKGLPKGAFSPDKYKRVIEELTAED